MNEIILKLLNEFSALTLPINPLIIKKIFEENSLEDELHSPEFNDHFELLIRLKQLSQDFLDSNAKLDVLNSRNRNFISINSQKEELSTKINELRASIDQLNQKLLPIYRQIEAKLNESLLSKDPLATPLNNSQFQAMKTMVSDRSADLDAACKDIDARRAKSRLVLLIDMFNKLDAELKNANIGYSDDTTIEQILEIAKTVDSEFNQLEIHYKTAEALQKVFAQQLSVEDLQIKNTEFEVQSNELAEKQELLSSQISSFPLDETTKFRLTQEFKDSPDKKSLIDSYRLKLDSLWDFVNPMAWATWGLNALTFNLDKQKHDKEQEVCKLSIDYLELLNFQRLNQAQQNDILANKQILEKAMPKPGLNIDSPNNGEVTTTSRRLIKDTIKLFNALHSFASIIELQEDSSETDFYLTLLLNMPLISDKLEKKKLISSNLADIVPLRTTIERLRTENGLLSEQDSLLPNLQAAEQETMTLTEQAPLRADYQEQLDLCRAYQSGAQELDALTINLAQNIAKQRQLQIDLRLQANKAPKGAEVGSLHNHLSTVAYTITLKFNQLQQLAIKTLTKKEASEVHETKINSEAIGDTSEPIKSELLGSQFSIVPDSTAQKFSEPETLPVQVLEETPLIEKEQQKISDSSNELLPSTEDLFSDAAVFEGRPQSTDNYSYYPTFINQEETFDSDSLTGYSSEEQVQSFTEEPSSEQVEESSEQSDDASFDEQAPALFSSPILVHQPRDLATTSIPDPVINTKITVDLLPGRKASATSEQSSSDAAKTAPLVITTSNLDLLPGSQDQIEPIGQYSADNLVTSSFSENTTSFSDEDKFQGHHAPMPMQQNLDNVKKWHKEIKSYILKHDEDIQQWYTSVYFSLKNPLTNESSCYKAAHLIRDVLFELEHRKNTDVIRAYMRICPNPVQDIHKLLAIKPSLLITENPVNDAELLIDCPNQLKKHYLHYNKLKSSYPIEAELFLQAIRSVHMIQLYTELPNHKITADQVPSLASDPRYASLKRHRGFLLVWEILEDLCRLMIGTITGQQEYEYTKRPCFFNTKSNQLIQEADTMIQDLLPANTI
jgi:hypothetical protein